MFCIDDLPSLRSLDKRAKNRYRMRIAMLIDFRWFQRDTGRIQYQKPRLGSNAKVEASEKQLNFMKHMPACDHMEPGEPSKPKFEHRMAAKRRYVKIRFQNRRLFAENQGRVRKAIGLAPSPNDFSMFFSALRFFY